MAGVRHFVASQASQEMCLPPRLSYKAQQEYKDKSRIGSEISDLLKKVIKGEKLEFGEEFFLNAYSPGWRNSLPD